MFVKWLRPAQKDMQALVDWYTAQAPEYLPDVAQKIWDSANSLTQFPEKGRIGFVSGSRELLVPRLPYMLVYTIQNNTVYILRLLHQSQNWPAC